MSRDIRRARRAKTLLREIADAPYCARCYRRDVPLDDTSTCPSCWRSESCAGERS